MKRYFLAAFFGIAAFAAQASSNSISKKISYRAQQTFAAEFGDRTDVQWSEAKNQTLKASFTMDGQEITAFISPEGELVATTVAMEKNQLPMKLRLALEAEMKGKSIDEIFYVEMPEESAYYFTSEKAGKKQVYRANANGRIHTATEIKMK